MIVRRQQLFGVFCVIAAISLLMIASEGFVDIDSLISTIWSGLLRQLDGFRSIPEPDCGFLIYKSNSKMGLGNLMFGYASTIGLALSSNRTPLLLRSHHEKLANYFRLPRQTKSADQINTSDHRRYEIVYQKGGCCRFDSDLRNIDCNSNKIIDGYLQSRMYFRSHERRIREHFRFRPKLLKACRSYLNDRLVSINRFKTGRRDRCVLIGVHPRRGDFTDSKNYRHGHNPANIDYMRSAIDYFQTQFQHVSCLVFVLGGDSHSWSWRLADSIRIRRPNNTVMLVLPDQPDVRDQGFDLCILSICNHTIMSTGSFGWWAAYLAGGLVTYQKAFARVGSLHYQEYDPETYFPPNWIGL